MSPLAPTIHFELPDELAATRPPEARGLARDDVRLLAAADGRIEHARFADLGRYLRPGDLLVVNTSATRAAALDGRHRRLGPVVVHLSTVLDDGSWVVELRSAPSAARPVRDARPGELIRLPAGGRLRLDAPVGAPAADGVRMWRAVSECTPDAAGLLAEFGRPIGYGYLARQWPLADYQTVFATPPRDADDPVKGASAEMPSAGRPFTTRLVTDLVSAGVLIAPVQLHCGVSSLEGGEAPLAERFRVPARTAMLANWVRAGGGRVIAVGTTVTRALESAARGDGQVTAAQGWTELVLGPDRPVTVVDGLITGLHDPQASHLLLLAALAGRRLLQRVYDAAVDERYLWHEFGDACLLLPPTRITTDPPWRRSLSVRPES